MEGFLEGKVDEEERIMPAISKIFGIEKVDKDIVRRILKKYYHPHNLIPSSIRSRGPIVVNISWTH